ncbi:MAG: hypothetical protein IKQ70_15980 [Bacteroidales bacterium]|nr:hypothetical protein [Bacteroidales bacterium]
METSFLQKISKYILIVLFAISIVLIGLFYYQVVPIEDQFEEEKIEHGTTALVLTWTEILFFVAAGLAVLAFIWDIIMNPKKSISTGIVVAGLALIAIVSYAVASDSMDSISPATMAKPTPGELKGSGTGLISLYIILGLNLLAIIWLEISSKLK